MPRQLDKYKLYERAVQSPDHHVEWFAEIFHNLHKVFPTRMREDFCGTFRLSCAWVQRNRRNRGLALDLDPEPLDYGAKKHFTKLTADQKRRLSVKRQDVLKPTRPLSDMIIACNFSFFIFQERKTLMRYFRAAHASLAKNGTIIFEMAGGPGMIERVSERKNFRRGGKPWFTYIWHQKTFDPITRRGTYGIHFHMADKSRSRIKDAFTYDWRLWTIPEVRDALAEAGFSKSVVYWETEHAGKGTGEYLPAETGDNSHAWVAYVLGIR